MKFKVGNHARVILGSSKDRVKGDIVTIENIYEFEGKTRVNCTVGAHMNIPITGYHKFWCYYDDLIKI
jgi:hypothetical protein